MTTMPSGRPPSLHIAKRVLLPPISARSTLVIDATPAAFSDKRRWELLFPPRRSVGRHSHPVLGPASSRAMLLNPPRARFTSPRVRGEVARGRALFGAHLDAGAALERLHDGGEVLVRADLLAGALERAHHRLGHLHRDAERLRLGEREADVLRHQAVGEAEIEGARH